jgi:diguanylate cyclase (GGDEF)-like protein/PAS domain S-box-containing protein
MGDAQDRERTDAPDVRSFRFLCAGSPDPLMLVDRSGRVVRVGPGAAHLLQRSPAELEGRRADAMLDPDDRFAFRKALSLFSEEDGSPAEERGPVRVQAEVSRRREEPLTVEFGLRTLPEHEGLVVLGLRERSGSPESVWQSVSPLLASTLDAAADGLLSLDRDRNILFFNRRFAEIWRLPDRLAGSGREEEILEHTRSRVSDPEQFLRIGERLEEEPEREHRDLLRLEDGRVIQRKVRPRRVHGRLAGWVATYRDITEERRAKRALEASEERYRLLFEHNVAGVFKISMDGSILEVNNAFAEMFGCEDPAELEGTPAEELYARPRERRRFQRRLEGSGAVRNYELEGIRRDGTSIWLLENSLLLTDPGSGREVVVGTVIDISRRKRLERELERMAYHDSLTGLPNRRLLREHAVQVLALAERGGHRVGLVYVDLVHFKEVNDTLGHDAGDEVLREVGRRLERHLRDSDMAARVGGDEFAVLLPEVGGVEGALSAARRLRRIFRSAVELDGGERQLDARLGVALYPDHASGFDDLLTAADRAMYRIHGDDDAGVSLFADGPSDGA